MLVTVFVGIGAFMIWGAVVGHRLRLFRCATCKSFVEENAATCGRCGGRIVGEIANLRDRLDREEELEAQEPAAATPDAREPDAADFDTH
jgi:rRNA maturation endonuclease Nob1